MISVISTQVFQTSDRSLTKEKRQFNRERIGFLINDTSTIGHPYVEK